MRAQPESVSCVASGCSAHPGEDDCGHLSVARTTDLAHPLPPSQRSPIQSIYGPELQSGWDGRDTQSIPRNGDDAMMMQPQNAHGRSKEQAVDHRSKIGYLVKYATLNWTESMGGLQYIQSLRHASESEMFSF